jgi:hypothetical protein
MAPLGRSRPDAYDAEESGGMAAALQNLRDRDKE